MTLFEESFNKIKNKQKSIEVRLNDDKRQNIRVGDLITFYKLTEKTERTTVKVLQNIHLKALKNYIVNLIFFYLVVKDMK